MTGQDYKNINQWIDEFKNERMLDDEDIFIYAFPQRVKKDKGINTTLEQFIVLLCEDGGFARVYISGEFAYEAAITNNFLVDLNNKCLSHLEETYLEK